MNDSITFNTRHLLVGRWVKVIESGYATPGHYYMVVDTFAYPEGLDSDTKIDGITVAVLGNNGSQTWVQQYTLIPTVGDVVKAITVPGRPEYDGHTCTVAEVGTMVNGLSGAPTLYGEFQSIQKPDDTERFGFFDWEYLKDGATLTVSTPEERDLIHQQQVNAELEDKVRNLTEERDRLQIRLNQMTSNRDNWQADFTTYAERIMQEAIDRGWCDTYESVISDIQSRLIVAVIPQREEEFEVEIEITGSVSFTHSVMVTARSQEDAEEMFNESPSDYVDVEEVLTDHVRYNSWDDTSAEAR